MNLNPRPVRWSDRTLSVLRADRLDACEKDLAGLGGPGLFDTETTDGDAERLFSQSWYAEEPEEPHLHTIEEMRAQVLTSFPAEMGLLSPEEYDLLLKAAVLGGEIPLYDENDLPAARSMARRLWCRTRPERGKWLSLPRQLCMAALLMTASEELKTVRERVEQITDAVDNTLYLAGSLSAEIVRRDLAFQLQGTMAADKPRLYDRMLRASFETVPDRNGRLMLVHPGLADPWTAVRKNRDDQPGLYQQDVEDLYESLMDVEDPLYDRLLNQIRGQMRPEIQAEDTVEDLILLAKQGAPVEELREVLGNKLICLPTEEMTSTLAEMRRRIPAWSTLSMESVQ